MFNREDNGSKQLAALVRSYIIYVEQQCFKESEKLSTFLSALSPFLRKYNKKFLVNTDFMRNVDRVLADEAKMLLNIKRLQNSGILERDNSGTPEDAVMSLLSNENVLFITEDMKQAQELYGMETPNDLTQLYIKTIADTAEMGDFPGLRPKKLPLGNAPIMAATVKQIIFDISALKYEWTSFFIEDLTSPGILTQHRFKIFVIQDQLDKAKVENDICKAAHNILNSFMHDNVAEIRQDLIHRNDQRMMQKLRTEGDIAVITFDGNRAGEFYNYNEPDHSGRIIIPTSYKDGSLSFDFTCPWRKDIISLSERLREEDSKIEDNFDKYEKIAEKEKNSSNAKASENLKVPNGSQKLRTNELNNSDEASSAFVRPLAQAEPSISVNVPNEEIVVNPGLATPHIDMGTIDPDKTYGKNVTSVEDMISLNKKEPVKPTISSQTQVKVAPVTSTKQKSTVSLLDGMPKAEPVSVDSAPIAFPADNKPIQRQVPDLHTVLSTNIGKSAEDISFKPTSVVTPLNPEGVSVSDGFVPKATESNEDAILRDSLKPKEEPKESENQNFKKPRIIKPIAPKPVEDVKATVSTPSPESIGVKAVETNNDKVSKAPTTGIQNPHAPTLFGKDSGRTIGNVSEDELSPKGTIQNPHAPTLFSKDSGRTIGNVSEDELSPKGTIQNPHAPTLFSKDSGRTIGNVSESELSPKGTIQNPHAPTLFGKDSGRTIGNVSADELSPEGTIQNPHAPTLASKVNFGTESEADKVSQASKIQNPDAPTLGSAIKPVLEKEVTNDHLVTDNPALNASLADLRSKIQQNREDISKEVSSKEEIHADKTIVQPKNDNLSDVLPTPNTSDAPVNVTSVASISSESVKEAPVVAKEAEEVKAFTPVNDVDAPIATTIAEASKIVTAPVVEDNKTAKVESVSDSVKPDETSERNDALTKAPEARTKHSTLLDAVLGKGEKPKQKIPLPELKTAEVSEPKEDKAVEVPEKSVEKPVSEAKEKKHGGLFGLFGKKAEKSSDVKKEEPVKTKDESVTAPVSSTPIADTKKEEQTPVKADEKAPKLEDKPSEDKESAKPTQAFDMKSFLGKAPPKMPVKEQKEDDDGPKTYKLKSSSLGFTLNSKQKAELKHEEEKKAEEEKEEKNHRKPQAFTLKGATSGFSLNKEQEEEIRHHHEEEEKARLAAEKEAQERAEALKNAEQSKPVDSVKGGETLKPLMPEAVSDSEAKPKVNVTGSDTSVPDDMVVPITEKSKERTEKPQEKVEKPVSNAPKGDDLVSSLMKKNKDIKEQQVEEAQAKEAARKRNILEKFSAKQREEEAKEKSRNELAHAEKPEVKKAIEPTGKNIELKGSSTGFTLNNEQLEKIEKQRAVEEEIKVLEERDRQEWLKPKEKHAPTSFKLEKQNTVFTMNEEDHAKFAEKREINKAAKGEAKEAEKKRQSQEYADLERQVNTVKAIEEFNLEGENSDFVFDPSALNVSDTTPVEDFVMTEERQEKLRRFEASRRPDVDVKRDLSGTSLFRSEDRKNTQNARKAGASRLTSEIRGFDAGLLSDRPKTVVHAETNKERNKQDYAAIDKVIRERTEAFNSAPKPKVLNVPNLGTRALESSTVAVEQQKPRVNVGAEVAVVGQNNSGDNSSLAVRSDNKTSLPEAPIMESASAAVMGENKAMATATVAETKPFPYSGKPYRAPVDLGIINIPGFNDTVLINNAEKKLDKPIVMSQGLAIYENDENTVVRIFGSGYLDASLISKLLSMIATPVSLSGIEWPIALAKNSSNDIIGCVLNKGNTTSLQTLCKSIDNAYALINRKNLVLMAINFVEKVMALNKLNIFLGEGDMNSIVVNRDDTVSIINLERAQVGDYLYSKMHGGIMPPELNDEEPVSANELSDRYVIAEVLFRLFFLGRGPFVKSRSQGVLNHQFTAFRFPTNYYDEMAAPKDSVLYIWSFFPEYIRQVFIDSLDYGYHNRNLRVDATRWLFFLKRWLQEFEQNKLQPMAYEIKPSRMYIGSASDMFSCKICHTPITKTESVATDGLCHYCFTQRGKMRICECCGKEFMVSYRDLMVGDKNARTRCPSCRTQFMRIKAIVKCKGCGKSYTVSDGHLIMYGERIYTFCEDCLKKQKAREALGINSEAAENKEAINPIADNRDVINSIKEQATQKE